MTDESSGHTLDDDALHALLDRPLTELTTDELMTLKDALAARGTRFYNSASTEQMILFFIAGNFSSAFFQTLGTRAGNRVANLPKRASDLVRKRVKRKGQPEEIHISAGDETTATATIAITADTPDEARLALLDLDVTADEVRGKTLRWDNDAGAWSAERADD
jgi:hypothetical protein